MAMFARHSHQFRRQRYAWLLALALLLPLAQAAAVWHLIGHHAGTVESRDGICSGPPTQSQRSRTELQLN